MGLVQLLDNSIKDTLGDDNGPWRQFILDHLDYIAKRTTNFDIDGPLMNQYRYDLGRFLKERMSRRYDMGWIVLLLNHMTSGMDFVNPGRYYIPTDDLIGNLRHSYSINAAKENL